MSLRKQIAKKTILQADQMLGDMEKSDDKLATMNDAIENRRKNMVMKKDGDQLLHYNLGCDLTELSQYGPGLRLFFELIKYSAIIFFVMGLISIPALISNAQGQSIDSVQLSSNSLSKLSISNQAQIILVLPAKGASNSEVSAVKAENQSRLAVFVDQAKSNLKWVAIPDILYSFVFFVFLIMFERYSKKVAKSSETQNSMPSQYAIEVSGFPPEMVDAKKISNHFREQFQVEVFECQIARNYNNTLFLHKEEAELLDQIKSEKSRAKALNKPISKKVNQMGIKLAKIQEKLQGLVHHSPEGKVLAHDEYPSLKAFVLLNSIEDKLKIQSQYNKIYDFLCFSNRPKAFIFNNHVLRMNFKPDEPSNILWENVEVTRGNRALRTLVVLLLVIIVMLITFAVIIIANIVKPVSTSTCPQGTISRSDASQSSLYTSCYCTSVSFSEMTSDQDLQNLCWDTWVNYATTYALTIVTGLIILIVNFLLRATIDALGQFNRYSTITKFSTSMATKLFLAFFVNTALITLLLQADIYGFIPAVTLTKPIPPLSDLQSDKKTEFSADFDRNWYSTIGTKITVTVCFFIITHLIFELALVPLFEYFRRRKVNKMVGKDVQRMANKAIQGPEFTITFYYASALNIIFTTLFYSSGIPIMLFIGSVILTIQYWVYKYRLLRVCRRPPTYDAGLHQRISQLLPWSIILHLAIGIYMYGQPLIFPNSSGQLQITMNSSTANSNSDYEAFVTVTEDKPVNNRISNVIYLFVMLIVLVAFYILRSILKNLGVLLECLCCCCKKAASIEPISQVRLYEEEFSMIEQRMIPSYNIKMNEKYRFIIQAIDLESKIEGNSLRDTHSAQASPRNKTETKENAVKIIDQI